MMHRKPWSPSAVEYLCKNYHKDIKELEIALGRSQATIRMKASSLGLAKRPSPLTAEEKESIRELAGKYTAQEIADLIGKTFGQVKTFAFNQNISLKVIRISAEQVAHMSRLYDSGWTINEIYQKFPQTSVTTIWNYIQDYNASNNFH